MPIQQHFRTEGYWVVIWTTKSAESNSRKLLQLMCIHSTNIDCNGLYQCLEGTVNFSKKQTTDKSREITVIFSMSNALLLQCKRNLETLYLVTNNNCNNVTVNIYRGFLYDLFYCPIKCSWQSSDVGTITSPTLQMWKPHFINVKAREIN